MPDLNLDFEFIDPAGARGEELAATWARLEIRVGHSLVSRVLDPAARTIRDGVYLPLYPVAEWIVLHWWRLLHEPALPSRTTYPGFDRRHCLASAGEGFALPWLRFEPLGEVVKVSWEAYAPALALIEFVADGHAHLPTDEVTAVLGAFVSAVVGRLDELDITGTVLQEEWQALQELDEEEREFCQLSARLGLDPLRIPDDVVDEVLAVLGGLPPSVRDDFAASVDPGHLGEEGQGLLAALHSLTSMTSGLRGMRELHGIFRDGLDYQRPPWQQGYAIADQLRTHLGLNGEPLATFGDLGASLGADAEALQTSLVVAPTTFRDLDGVLGYDDDRSPGVVIRRGSDEARRFTFCRALFDYVTTESYSPSLVTTATTNRQKRNRAFAAEFLAPAAALRNLVESQIVDEEDVDRLAARFGVSWAVIQHQLQNHQIAHLRPGD